MSREFDRAIRHPGGVTISVAAKLLRVSPQVLRKWEKAKLIPRAARRPVHLSERDRWRTYTGEQLAVIRAFVDKRKRELAKRPEHRRAFGREWPPPKKRTG